MYMIFITDILNWFKSIQNISNTKTKNNEAYSLMLNISIWFEQMQPNLHKDHLLRDTTYYRIWA